MPERLAALEIPRVTDLCLNAMAATTVLDVGCGSGIFCEAFRNRGLFCAGADLNAGLLSAARRYSPDVRVAQAVSEHLPFGDASFDLVFMSHVLHEVDDPAITLSECGRVARRRIAVLEWPYRQTPLGPPLTHRLAPEAIGQAAARAGLSRILPIVLRVMVLYLIDAV